MGLRLGTSGRVAQGNKAAEIYIVRLTFRQFRMSLKDGKLKFSTSKIRRSVSQSERGFIQASDQNLSILKGIANGNSCQKWTSIIVPRTYCVWLGPSCFPHISLSFMSIKVVMDGMESAILGKNGSQFSSSLFFFRIMLKGIQWIIEELAKKSYHYDMIAIFAHSVTCVKSWFQENAKTLGRGSVTFSNMVDMLGGTGKGNSSETEDERAPLLQTRWSWSSQYLQCN